MNEAFEPEEIDPEAEWAVKAQALKELQEIFDRLQEEE